MFRSYETIVNPDLQMSLGLQQFEVRGWKDTALSPLHFQVLTQKQIKEFILMIHFIRYMEGSVSYSLTGEEFVVLYKLKYCQCWRRKQDQRLLNYLIG